MRDNTSALKKARTVIKRSANKIAKRILDLHENIDGHEEQITDQLASEITLHLLEEIQKQLDDKIIEGIKFSIKVYKKKTEEPLTGADLAGIIDIDFGNRRIKKVYLAQAKIGKITKDDDGQETINFYNSDIIRQVRSMLAITNSAFVFVYTKAGVKIISAEHINSLNRAKINIEEVYTRDLGYFYEQLFDCWAGDPKLIPYPIEKTRLEYFAERTNAKNVFLLEAISESRKKSAASYIELD